MEEKKRLFFGLEISAPWPIKYPSGRLLDETHRHMTLAFLGNVDYRKLKAALPSLPQPSFRVGLVGQFDRCLLLPPRNPRVVASHIDWIDEADALIRFQKQLTQWLQKAEFQIDDRRDFLPHVTLCRAPFAPKEWKKAFTILPCVTKDLHLYESLGNLKYESIWKYSFKSPFEEIEHTADIAFRIHGESMVQLHRHAQIALSFRFPQLLSYISKQAAIRSLEEIVVDLNRIVCKADAEIGCPFKAVSFHGNVIQSDDILTWEMIVDV